MARIRELTQDEASAEARAIFEEQEKRLGFVSNTGKVYAFRPTIYRGVQALAQGIEASALLSAELRHLVCVKTASINGCPF